MRNRQRLRCREYVTVTNKFSDYENHLHYLVILFLTNNRITGDLYFKRCTELFSTLAVSVKIYKAPVFRVNFVEIGVTLCI